MPDRPKTNAEKAMAANARSRAKQGRQSDEAIRKDVERRTTSQQPPGTDGFRPDGKR